MCAHCVFVDVWRGERMGGRRGGVGRGKEGGRENLSKTRVHQWKQFSTSSNSVALQRGDWSLRAPARKAGCHSGLGHKKRKESTGCSLSSGIRPSQKEPCVLVGPGPAQLPPQGVPGSGLLCNSSSLGFLSCKP